MFTHQGRKWRNIFPQKYFWQKNRQGRILEVINYGSYTVCGTFITPRRTENRELWISYKVTFTRFVDSWIPEARPQEEPIPSSLKILIKLYLSFLASSHLTPFYFLRLNGKNKTHFLKFPPPLPWKAHSALQLLTKTEYNGKGGNPNQPPPLNRALEKQRQGRQQLGQRNGHLSGHF